MRLEIRKKTYFKQVINFLIVNKGLKIEYIKSKKFLLGFRVPFHIQISRF